MKTLTWWVMLAMAPALTDTMTFDSAAIGRTPAGWRTSVPSPGPSPAWRIIKDPSAPTQPYVLAHVPDGTAQASFPMVLLEQSACRDGEISVKFKTVAGKGATDAGLVWRYRDADNYYVVRADARGQNVAVYRVVNGKPQPLTPRGRPPAGYAVPHSVAPAGWGILKVVFKGPAFSVYYDHRRILRADDSAYLGAGKVGLWTRGDTLAYFDNFRFIPRQ